MKDHADVVVIGGGIAGTSAAYFLRRAGTDVTLVERSDIASGASGRNGGGFRQSARALPEIPLAVAAVEMAPGVWEEIGENVEYVRRGNLRLAESEEQLRTMAESVPRQQDAGLRAVRLVSREEALGIVPVLAGDRVWGGTFCPTDGHVNPMLACFALARGARRLGAHVLRGTPVTGIDVERGRVVGVRTTRGHIATPCVINAAGAGAIEVAAMAGLSVRGRVATYQAMVTERVPPIFPVMFGVASATLYWRQTVSGNVLFGGGGLASRRDERPRTTVDWSVIPPVAAHLLQLVPSLRELKLLRAWTGQDLETPDHVPIIGQAPELDGFIYATGYSGHGMPMGLITGRLLTELLVEGKPSLPFSGFEPGRFRDAA